MTRYLTLDEVLELHRLILEQSGGAAGLRDPAALASAIAQPQMTFDGHDLYETLVEKASSFAYSLIMNHAFVDGNKRIGHAAMETFLELNGVELNASVDEQERVVLGVAAGNIKREEFAEWIGNHVAGVP